MATGEAEEYGMQLEEAKSQEEAKILSQKPSGRPEKSAPKSSAPKQSSNKLGALKKLFTKPFSGSSSDRASSAEAGQTSKETSVLDASRFSQAMPTETVSQPSSLSEVRAKESAPIDSSRVEAETTMPSETTQPREARLSQPTAATNPRPAAEIASRLPAEESERYWRSERSYQPQHDPQYRASPPVQPYDYRGQFFDYPQMGGPPMYMGQQSYYDRSQAGKSEAFDPTPYLPPKQEYDVDYATGRYRRERGTREPAEWDSGRYLGEFGAQRIRSGNFS